MLLSGKMKYMASEERISKKTGNKYRMGLFIQGVDTINFVLPEGFIGKELQEYEVGLRYNTQYNSLQMVTATALSATK